MDDRSQWPIVKRSLGESADDDGFVPGTPEERWAMMRELAANAWAFYDVDELRRSESMEARQIVRVTRLHDRYAEDKFPPVI